MVGPVYPTWKALAKRIHRVVSLYTETCHLIVEVFFNLLDAELKTGIYRNHTNQVRPHSALGYKAPAEGAQ